MKRATILFTALWLTLGAAAAGNPKADPRAVVEAGNARFTVLTPQLIRMEWSEDGRFEDRATLTFVNRETPVPDFKVRDTKSRLTITTPALTLEGAHPLFFRTVANDLAQAELTSSYALNVLKVKKVAYVHDNGEYGKGFASQNRTLLEKGGVETVLFEAITPDAVDFSPTIRKLKRAKPDLIVFGGYQPAASKLVQQMRRDRVKTPLMGPDGVKDETFLKMTGKDSEGTLASYPKDTSALDMYKQAREAHIKAFGSEPGFGYYNAYAAMQALLKAIETSGGTATDQLLEGLRKNTVDTPLGNLSFNKNGDAAGLGLSIYEARGGKFVETDHNIILK